MDLTYHFPPELFNLLVDTIPLLNRSKLDTFNFFRGAGVSDRLMGVPLAKWSVNKESVNKYEIVRETLRVLNEQGEAQLRQRREVVKRVVEFDSFETCWEKDRLKAKGLVGEIRNVVNIKDSFTRMNIERATAWKEKREQVQAEQREQVARADRIRQIRERLFGLFSMTEPQKRGKALEQVLNDLFSAYEVSVRESFVVVSDDCGGVIEQVDGVIEIKGHLYLVEMKWWKSPLGKAEISEHLVRVFMRSDCRAIIISASEFTVPAVATCRDALQSKVVVLCTLQEIVRWLEIEADIPSLLEMKIQAAILQREPYLSLLNSN